MHTYVCMYINICICIYTDGLYTKEKRAHTHIELIRECLAA